MRKPRVHFGRPHVVQQRALCGRAEVDLTDNPHAVTCRDCRAYSEWANALNRDRWNNETDTLHTLQLMTQR